jgi:homocysteine S-methyltransferase
MRAQMAAAGEAGAEVGVGLARELLVELTEVIAVQGAYLMPPFGRYDLAAAIIEGLRVSVAR